MWVKEQWGHVPLKSIQLCANLSGYQWGEKLVWWHHHQAWCLHLPPDLEASERTCVHEQTCKQKGVTGSPKGCLSATKGDRLRVQVDGPGLPWSRQTFLLEFKGVVP